MNSNFTSKFHKWKNKKRKKRQSKIKNGKNEVFLKNKKRKKTFLHLWFKVVLKCRANLVPSYISDLVANYAPTRTLRSGDSAFLFAPRTKTVVAARAFSSSGPLVWNNLPQEIRHIESIEVFKHKLKTFLLSRIF